MIRLRNVEKFFQHGATKTFVLRRIDVDIQEGDFVSIMGPSGAGKSTLLHLIGMHDTQLDRRVSLPGLPDPRDEEEGSRRDLQEVLRVRVPELSPAGFADGVRESGDPAFLPQRPQIRARRGGVRRARPVSDGRQEGSVPESAIGRAAATGRRRARDHRQSESDPGRRAHGQSPLQPGQGDHGGVQEAQ